MKNFEIFYVANINRSILKNMLVRNTIVISVKLIGEEGKATVSHAGDSPAGGGYRPRHGRL